MNLDLLAKLLQSKGIAPESVSVENAIVGSINNDGTVNISIKGVPILKVPTFREVQVGNVNVVRTTDGRLFVI